MRRTEAHHDLEKVALFGPLQAVDAAAIVGSNEAAGMIVIEHGLKVVRVLKTARPGERGDVHLFGADQAQPASEEQNHGKQTHKVSQIRLQYSPKLHDGREHLATRIVSSSEVLLTLLEKLRKSFAHSLGSKSRPRIGE